MMATLAEMRRAMIARVRDGGGAAARDERRAAFDNAGLAGPLAALVAKVATRAHAITDEDFAAARAAGHSEDQLFEIVVCAALGQAARQYDTALAALDAASAAE
jgi:alkylhydroperoxidase family enzyme